MWRWFSHESSPLWQNDVRAFAVLHPFHKSSQWFAGKKGGEGAWSRYISPQEMGWACLYPAVGDGTGQACSKKTHTHKPLKKKRERWNITSHLHSHVNARGSKLQTRWPWSDKHEIKMKNVQPESRKMGLSASSAGNRSLTMNPSLLHGSREPPMNYSSRLAALLRFELIPGAICCCLRAMQPPPRRTPAFGSLLIAWPWLCVPL